MGFHVGDEKWLGALEPTAKQMCDFLVLLEALDYI